MKFLLCLIVAFWIFFGGCWIVNVVKLSQCDWSEQGSWKGEIIHGIGLIPGCSMITVWNNDN